MKVFARLFIWIRRICWLLLLGSPIRRAGLLSLRMTMGLLRLICRFIRYSMVCVVILFCWEACLRIVVMLWLLGRLRVGLELTLMNVSIPIYLCGWRLRDMCLRRRGVRCLRNLKVSSLIVSVTLWRGVRSSRLLMLLRVRIMLYLGTRMVCVWLGLCL